MEFLKEGWYLGVLFREGPIFFRVKARDFKAVPVEANTLPAGQTADFEPTDRVGNKLLEPQQTAFIEHAFIGVYPPEVELGMAYPPQDDRSGLPGFVFETAPYITDGVRSPYDSPTFEVFTFRDIYPILKLRNRGDVDVTPKLNLVIGLYTYEVVTDEDKIIKLLDGKIPSKFYAFLSPLQAPNWLYKEYSGVFDIGRRYW